MSDAGRKMIEGLQDAIRGNITRVHIDGQTWVRHDAESPEGMLSSARGKIGDLTMRIDVLEAALHEIAKLDRHKNPATWGRTMIDGEYAAIAKRALNKGA